MLLSIVISSVSLFITIFINTKLNTQVKEISFIHKRAQRAKRVQEMAEIQAQKDKARSKSIMKKKK